MEMLRLDEKTLTFCCQNFEVCYLSYFIYLASPQLEYDTHIYIKIWAGRPLHPSQLTTLNPPLKYK